MSGPRRRLLCLPSGSSCSFVPRRIPASTLLLCLSHYSSQSQINFAYSLISCLSPAIERKLQKGQATSLLLVDLSSELKQFLGHDWCGLISWASSCKAKGCRFNFGSGHMPGLGVWSSCTRGNQSMFLCRINVSFSFFLSPSPSL